MRVPSCPPKPKYLRVCDRDVVVMSYPGLSLLRFVSLVSCDQYQSRAWSWTLFGILFVMHMATSHSIGFAKMINRTHARILASRNYSMLIQFQCNKMQCEFNVNFISFHCQFICNAMPIQFQFNTNSVKFINSLVSVKSSNARHIARWRHSKGSFWVMTGNDCSIRGLPNTGRFTLKRGKVKQ